jgi:hypothetical protein
MSKIGSVFSAKNFSSGRHFKTFPLENDKKYFFIFSPSKNYFLIDFLFILLFFPMLAQNFYSLSVIFFIYIFAPSYKALFLFYIYLSYEVNRIQKN